MKTQIKSLLNSIIFLVVISLSVAASAELKPGDFTIGGNGIEVGPDGERQNLNSMTPVARANFIRDLRATLGSTDHQLQSRVIQALFILKDEEGIKQIVEMYHGDDINSSAQSFGCMVQYSRAIIIGSSGNLVAERHFNGRGRIDRKAVKTGKVAETASRLFWH